MVVPTRGPAPWLAEALAGAAADGPREIVVVEDGSAVVDEAGLPPRTRLLRLDPVGRSLARNAGVRAAGTPLVAFLDADDVTLSGRFERQAATLAASPGAALCFGTVEAIDGDGRPIADQTVEQERRMAALLGRSAGYVSLLVDCPIFTSATMVRRDAFLAAGGYDVRHDAYEDLDLYLRLSRAGGLVPCPGGPVAQHRRHGGNTTSDWLYAGALRVADRHLPAATGEARRLLLERRVDSLWGLRSPEARQAVLAALRAEPSLLGHPRFRRRLLAALVPAAVRDLLRAAR